MIGSVDLGVESDPMPASLTLQLLQHLHLLRRAVLCCTILYYTVSWTVPVMNPAPIKQ